MAVMASCEPETDGPHLLFIAEDHKIDQMILRKAFEVAGAKVQLRFFGNGAELLDCLYSRNVFAGQALASLPLLIIMDLNMPRLGGEKAIEILRSDKTFDGLPVIVFSTSNSNEQVQKCYTIGANAFLTKSADFVRLTDDMKSLVNFWGRVAPSSAQLRHLQQTPAHEHGRGN